MPYTKKFAETLYNPAWLADEYVGKQRSAADIAKEIGTDASAVLRRLQRYGIPVRSNSEAQLLAPHGGSHAPRPRKAKDTLHNYEWLHEHYVRRGMNASEVARLVGVEVPSVLLALKKFGFRVRGIAEAKQGRHTPKTILPDPCLVCGEPACETNHIDRDHDNNREENKEPLCERCHKSQHRVEELLALHKLVEDFGYSMRDLHAEARRIISGRGPRDRRYVVRALEDLSEAKKVLRQRIMTRVRERLAARG